MRAEPDLQRGVTRAADDRTICAIDPSGRRFPVGKLEAHRLGLLHDAVSVFVFDGEAMLLQRRAAAKYHCGGLWANACCTHPDWGERLEQSARRRLREELGVDLALSEAGETTYRADVGKGLVEHERVRLFTASADAASLAVSPDPDEVSEVRWATRSDLMAEVARDPGAFAPWLRIYLDRWDTLGLTG